MADCGVAFPQAGWGLSATWGVPDAVARALSWARSSSGTEGSRKEWAITSPPPVPARLMMDLLPPE